MDSIAAFEFRRKVFATINATWRPAKQKDKSLVIVEKELFISLKMRCFTPEWVSGALKAVYDLMEGKGEDADVDVEESIFPKMVGSSRPKEAATLAADLFLNLPLVVWYFSSIKSLSDRWEDPKASNNVLRSVKTR